VLVKHGDKGLLGGEIERSFNGMRLVQETGIVLFSRRPMLEFDKRQFERGLLFPLYILHDTFILRK
jgi:hypothetical protein